MPILLLFFLFAYFMSFQISIAGMEALIGTVAVPGYILSFYRKDFFVPRKWICISLGIFLVAAIISFLVNIGEPHLFLKYIRKFRWIITFFGVMQFIYHYHSMIPYRRLVLAGQIIALIATGYCVYQFFTAHDPFRPNVVFHRLYATSNYWRPNSFFGLPTTHAYASAMFFCFSLAFFLHWPARTRFQKIIENVYLILAPLNIFITFTRAAWIACIASTLAVLRLSRSKYFLRSIFIFVIIFTACYTTFPTFVNRVDSIFDSKYEANKHRIYLWKANLMIFADYPFFGYGFNNDKDRSLVDSYLDKLDKPEIMRNHPHNTYINFLASLGIFGALPFFLFLALNVYGSLRGYRHSQGLHHTLYLGILGAQAILLIGGITECTFEDGELAHQYLFYIAIQEVLLKRDFQSTQL